MEFGMQIDWILAKDVLFISEPQKLCLCDEVACRELQFRIALECSFVFSLYFKNVKSMKINFDFIILVTIC